MGLEEILEVVDIPRQERWGSLGEVAGTGVKMVIVAGGLTCGAALQGWVRVQMAEP